jgi:hypothetical protein
VLLADEATGNVDPKTAEHVFATLATLVKATGASPFELVSWTQRDSTPSPIGLARAERRHALMNDDTEHSHEYRVTDPAWRLLSRRRAVPISLRSGIRGHRMDRADVGRMN